MKTNLLMLSLLAGLFALNLPVVHAETDSDSGIVRKEKKAKKAKRSKKDSAKEETTEEAEEESVVASILKQNTYFNQSTPNFKADYFIFLKSASWCGPCNAEMPKVARAYEQMKASGRVELILMSHDQTQEAAEKFLQKYNATFPGMMRGSQYPDMPKSRGIPSAAILKADGTVITSGHGAIIQSWKEHTIGKYAIIGDSGEPLVGKALKKIKLLQGKASANADFYIYFYQPTINEESLALLAQEAKDMKKAKFECIYINGDDSATNVQKTLRKNKLKVAAALKKTAGVSELPGIGALGSQETVTVVTKSGTVVTEGRAELLGEWKDIAEANKK